MENDTDVVQMGKDPENAMQPQNNQPPAEAEVDDATTFEDRYDKEGQMRLSEILINALLAIITIVILWKSQNVLGGGQFSIERFRKEVDRPYLTDIQIGEAGKCPKNTFEIKPSVFENTVEGCACIYTGNTVVNKRELDENIEEIISPSAASSIRDLGWSDGYYGSYGSYYYGSYYGSYGSYYGYYGSYYGYYGSYYGYYGSYYGYYWGYYYGYSDAGGFYSDAGWFYSDGPIYGGSGSGSSGSGSSDEYVNFYSDTGDYVSNVNFDAVLNSVGNSYYYSDISSNPDAFIYDNYDRNSYTAYAASQYSDLGPLLESILKEKTDSINNYEEQLDTFNKDGEFDEDAYQVYLQSMYEDEIYSDYYRTKVMNESYSDYDYSQYYRVSKFTTNDYNYHYEKNEEYVFQQPCYKLNPLYDQFICRPQPTIDAIAIDSYFGDDEVICASNSYSMSTHDVIDNILKYGDEDDPCLADDAHDCGLFCVTGNTKCPIIYVGLDTADGTFSTATSQMDTPSANFIKQNFMFSYGSGNDKAKINFFYWVSTGYNTDYVKQNSWIKPYFDALPVIGLKIGENVICENGFDSRSLNSIHPLLVKNQCPEDQSFSQLSIQPLIPNDYLSLEKILVNNDHFDVLLNLTNTDLFSDSKWYIFQKTAFQRYFMNCIVSLNNANFLVKSKKISLLKDKLEFFTTLAADFEAINITTKITLALTFVSGITLGLFGLYVLIGYTFFGTCKCIKSKGRKEQIEILEKIIGVFSNLIDLAMLGLTIYAFIVLVKSKKRVDDAIDTGCFEGSSLTQLINYSKILGNFNSNGIQSIMIFGLRIILTYVLLTMRLRRDRMAAQSGLTQNPEIKPIQQKFSSINKIFKFFFLFYRFLSLYIFNKFFFCACLASTNGMLLIYLGQEILMNNYQFRQVLI